MLVFRRTWHQTSDYRQERGDMTDAFGSRVAFKLDVSSALNLHIVQRIHCTSVCWEGVCVCVEHEIKSVDHPVDLKYLNFEGLNMCSWVIMIVLIEINLNMNAQMECVYVCVCKTMSLCPVPIGSVLGSPRPASGSDPAPFCSSTSKMGNPFLLWSVPPQQGPHRSISAPSKVSSNVLSPFLPLSG